MTESSVSGALLQMHCFTLWGTLLLPVLTALVAALQVPTEEGQGQQGTACLQVSLLKKQFDIWSYIEQRAYCFPQVDVIRHTDSGNPARPAVPHQVRSIRGPGPVEPYVCVCLAGEPWDKTLLGLLM